MAWLVRKISRGKWPNEKNLPLQDMPGDCVSSELGTTRNTLSFWYVENSGDDDLKSAVTALATGPTIKNIESMDIVWLDLKQFLDKGIIIEESDGTTAIGDLVKTHRDARDITYSSLGIISKMILESIHIGQYKKIKDTVIKKYLQEAFLSGKIDRNKCTPQLFEKLSLQNNTTPFK